MNTGKRPSANHVESRLQSACLVGLYVLFVLSGTGCRTGDVDFSRIINEPAPLPEKVRSEFGVVGVLPAGAASMAELTRPANRVEAMLPIAGKTFSAVRRSTEPDESDLERFNSKTGRYETHPRAVEIEFQEDVASLAFSVIIAGVAGTIGGLLAGVPEAKIQESESTLRRALAEQPLATSLSERVQQWATKRHVTNLISIPESAAAKVTSPTNLTALSTLGIDSVLFMNVFYQRFDDAAGVNPSMTFAAGVNLQVIRVKDGALLHTGFLDYRGRQKKFTEWAARDGKSFRTELSRSSQTFAAAIVERLFASGAK